jgi:NAD-dependent oxidoreductase involved in siderophore biosynthesis
MPVMVKGAAPVFVKVEFCDALAVLSGTFAKVKVDGVKVTSGVVPGAPVPVRATVCGVPAALSAMLTLAVRVPVANGLKVTEIVQLNPAVRVNGTG